MSDIRVVRRPTTKSPCENLTAKRLREAIDLGVKLAEESALRRLTLKRSTSASSISIAAGRGWFGTGTAASSSSAAVPEILNGQKRRPPN
jgi:hypothetical protein